MQFRSPTTAVSSSISLEVPAGAVVVIERWDLCCEPRRASGGSCLRWRRCARGEGLRMRRLSLSFLLLLASFAAGDIAAAQVDAQSRLTTLFTTEPIPAEWFATSFLAQVPIEQVRRVVASYETQLGSYKSLRALPDGSYEVAFTHGTTNATIHLDAQGKIEGLIFKAPKPAARSLDEGLGALRALRGTIGFLVLDGNQEIASQNAGSALSVGSAFKL